MRFPAPEVIIRWLRWLVALAALVITCVPSALWHHPATDLIQTGFDPNLVYASAGATVSRDLATLASSGDPSASIASAASVNVLSTPLTRFAVSMQVTVREDARGAIPLRIGVWSVWTGAGYFVEFTGNSILTDAVAKGEPGRTLVGGDVTRVQQLGFYTIGQPYVVKILVDRSKAMTVLVTGGVLSARDSVTAADIPELFRSNRVALTASNSSSLGAVQAELSDYALTLPHQMYWANKADDVVERITLVALLILAAVVVVAGGANWLAQRGHLTSHSARPTGSSATKNYANTRKRSVTAIALAVVAYLVGNALLFPLGGHPFDMGVEKLYAYVARTYGMSELYFTPNVVSLAGVWDGVPYIEAAFPYQAAVAYLFTGIGWLQSLVFAGGGVFSINSVTLEYLIKAVNVVFGLGDAVLIYLIVRQVGLNERWSLGAAALFLFNPAVWFSAAVWGQTHVISIFFVLAAILLAEKGYPQWAWLTLFIAVLTRPQMLVFGLLVGIVLLRKFHWKQSVSAMGWAFTLIFISLAPFTLTTSPSLPIDIMLNVFRIQEAGGNEVALTTVSQDALSIWPLVTYAAHGASGLQRAFTPSSASLVGSLTYLRVSQILTLAAILFVTVVLLFRKRATTGAGAYLPFVALGITSFLMLLTGLVATHFLLALPFLLLCRRWLGGGAYIGIAVIWTITTLVPMYGDMGVVITNLRYPLLSPDHNYVTRFFVQLYSSDRFITVGVVGNVCAVIWLAYLSFRPAAPSSRVNAGVRIA